MSKTAEERIAELEGRLRDTETESKKVQNHYNQAYRALQDSQQNEAYYKGQFETLNSIQSRSGSEDTTHNEYNDYENSGDIEKTIDRIVNERLEPRMKMVQQYATDALQQTAGREVDRALKSFKDKHPESRKIMDFERLIMLDAADEIKRRQNVGQQVGDVKDIALQIAQTRVTKYNKLESKLSEENEKRRNAAQQKAMLPDMFSAAGFEELPQSPASAKEAGDLLEDLIRRQKSN